MKIHQKIINEVVDEKKCDPNVVCIFLFGSLARNTATKDSDVDIELVCKTGKYSDKREIRYGVKVDIETWPLAKLLKRIEQQPFLSYPYLEEKILYDPEGVGRLIQKELNVYFKDHSEVLAVWKKWTAKYLTEKKKCIKKTESERLKETKEFYDLLEKRCAGKVSRKW